ncbi:helix-turn-helix domain-containing protein [Fodinibius salsisoli]|uniref:Helix-turn-helix transcriptional regulator n=1 Tax=Fodinibius salsisoli TaxID=2820877 RepID=A0ABT3PI04_9BACT|nr:AraC family transcriptional regulator [Fodinibius salsisoli]MCW9705542.1 helix-turn-helix transcriptional regulator [Fodinibius salsisoli]
MTTLDPIKHDYQLFLSKLQLLLTGSGIKSGRPTFQYERDPKEEQSSDTNQALPRVGRVIVYIEENLTEQLSLEKLAEETQLSKYQLIRLFRKEQDTTPWKFLIAKRIEKVKELLKEGMSPGQAAVEAGFYDQSHLNKTFREKVGQTPKEYQEQNFKNRN